MTLKAATVARDAYSRLEVQYASFESGERDDVMEGYSIVEEGFAEDVQRERFGRRTT